MEGKSDEESSSDLGTLGSSDDCSSDGDLFNFQCSTGDGGRNDLPIKVMLLVFILVFCALGHDKHSHLMLRLLSAKTQMEEDTSTDGLLKVTQTMSSLLSKVFKAAHSHLTCILSSAKPAIVEEDNPDGLAKVLTHI